MAEDLSIKVKVEPDGGGVQGKLDEIAKKSKMKSFPMLDERTQHVIIRCKCRIFEWRIQT